MVLALLFKTPTCANDDIFSTLAALVFALILMYIIVDLRLRDYDARMRFRHLSMVDLLTGTINKGTCKELCIDHLNHRTDSMISALIVIDLDNFKSVNDTMGHQFGDDLLEAVGKRLNSSFRSSDIVGRIGGDEFCIMMKNISGTECVADKLSEVQNAVNSVALATLNEKRTCSIGAAITPNSQISFEELFALADAALYKAKLKGKNKYVIEFAPDTQTSTAPVNIDPLIHM